MRIFLHHIHCSLALSDFSDERVRSIPQIPLPSYFTTDFDRIRHSRLYALAFYSLGVSPYRNDHRSLRRQYNRRYQMYPHGDPLQGSKKWIQTYPASQCRTSGTGEQTGYLPFHPIHSIGLHLFVRGNFYYQHTHYDGLWSRFSGVSGNSYLKYGQYGTGTWHVWSGFLMEWIARCSQMAAFLPNAVGASGIIYGIIAFHFRLLEEELNKDWYKLIGVLKKPFLLPRLCKKYKY